MSRMISFLSIKVKIIKQLIMALINEKREKFITHEKQNIYIVRYDDAFKTLILNQIQFQFQP